MADLTKLDSSLIDEISDILEKPKAISTNAAMRIQLKLLSQIWLSQNQIIDHVTIQNGRIKKNQEEIESLKQKNIISWVSANKAKSFIIFIGVFALNSLVNWQGVRRPLIQATLRILGFDIPIELIP